MTEKEQKKAAKEFAQRWQGKGYEKGQSQQFWIDLLVNVYGVEDIAGFISFEDQVHLDHTSFIDGYIKSTRVMIEQKSLGKDLRKAIRQSDGSLLNPFSITKISESIIGQSNAVNEISKSLWYLTSVERKKPYVIMLYGNSSLGKTELVREIAKYFFDGKVLEKHLSMFKNNNYSDYFFGEEPNRRSIGFDLLERDSNLIFLDELDKCPDFFYSAFYTLFDNNEFKDSTYDVDISGAIIILTSNFHNKDDMKKRLGLPIFYRIDKFIKFEDFSAKTIYDITMKEIRAKKAEYKDKISEEEIYKDENARTIKFKVQQVIEDLLFREVIN